jgi:integron integrase
MFIIASQLQQQFFAALRQQAMPPTQHVAYLKWLRYYLDFCQKYNQPSNSRDSLPRFLAKLQEKQQTLDQQAQATDAITLYYVLTAEPPMRADASPHKTIARPAPRSTPPPKPPAAPNTTQTSPPSAHTVPAPIANRPPTAQPCVPAPLAPAVNLTTVAVLAAPASIGQPGGISPTGASWQAEYASLTNTIQLRHYSRRTLRTYVQWVRRFQAFTRSKPPAVLSSEDVKAFLTHLAVKRQVSASSQNQAFNALLFFFRHVLHKEFGPLNGVVRAKRKRYIPVVLSRPEIDAILAQLTSPYTLVVKLLYGCGLRLFECLNLRIHCLNFEAGILTVHDGKGQKDRTVPLPQTIITELRTHLTTVKVLHQEDLQHQYAGVMLPHALALKYKHAAREWRWQWVFPAIELTPIPDTQELRRYHLHESLVQKAIKVAVEQAGLTKRASAHTFCHCFASHLLQAHYDIRTIQTLLGHSDIRTTLIYTQTVPSVTLKTAQSPLDF